MSKLLIPLTDKNLAANGYQKLPGGMILQWGSYTQTVTSGAGTTNVPMYQAGGSVNFPIAFPNGVLVITSAPRDNDKIVLEYANTTGRTLTSFSYVCGGIQNQGTAPATVNLIVDWIAIGW